MRNYFTGKKKKNNTGKQKKNGSGKQPRRVSRLQASRGNWNGKQTARRSMDQTGHNEGHANGSGAAPRRSRTRTHPARCTRRTGPGRAASVAPPSRVHPDPLPAYFQPRRPLVRGAGSVAWRRVFRAKDTFPVPFTA